MFKRVALHWRYLALYIGREGHGGRWRYIYFSPLVISIMTIVAAAIAIFLAAAIAHAGWTWQP